MRAIMCAVPGEISGGSLKSVRAARRVIDVFEALRDEADGLSLTEVAQRTGMPLSTALRYLGTLEERRYVQRHPLTGRYVIGLAVPAPAGFFSRLTQLARPSMERLNRQLEENILLATLDRHRVVVLDLLESPHSVRLVADPDGRNHLHASAIGKALASTVRDETLRELVTTVGLPALTARTITSLDVFLEEVAGVRARGFAINDQEVEVGARSVAVPVPTPRLHLALGMAAPAMRLAPEACGRVAEMLRREAAAIGGVLAPGP